jgi:hypothetical protein
MAENNGFRRPSEKLQQTRRELLESCRECVALGGVRASGFGGRMGARAACRLSPSPTTPLCLRAVRSGIARKPTATARHARIAHAAPTAETGRRVGRSLRAQTTERFFLPLAGPDSAGHISGWAQGLVNQSPPQYKHSQGG